MHQEIVTLRQVLKSATPQLALASPRPVHALKSSGKITHRAWFPPEEYKQLYQATRRRAAESKGKRYEWECAQLHDFVLFMANTGLRPDEVMRIEYRDVTIVEDDDTDETSPKTAAPVWK